jgi:hypothetical protein
MKQHTPRHATDAVPHSHPHLDFCIAVDPRASPEQVEAYWSDLNAWCLDRLLFLGGSPQAGFVFDPLHRLTVRMRAALYKRMTLAPCFRATRVSEASLRIAHTLHRTDPWLAYQARLEACAQAQRILAETLLECSDALALMADFTPDMHTAVG